MFDSIENLKLVYSSQGISSPRSGTRKYNAFIFRTSGSALFTIDDKTIISNEGEMVFLPKGTTYDFKPVSEKECKFTSIDFDADLTCPKPTAYNLQSFSELNYICNHFTNLWKFGNQSDKYKCISLFYSLLAYISNIENTNYSYKRKFEIIEPAVNYLKDNIYDSSLKADNLHLLCGISDTYFRKLFNAKFGTTPQKYIISKRISHAKSLIDSGNFASISEIAMSVGYTDALYFSRAFKKKYGLSPLNMAKEI